MPATDRITVYVIDYGRTYLVLQWTDPTTGKRKTQSSKCTKRRDAERAAKTLEDRLNSLIPRGDGLVSWDQFVEKYTTQHMRALQPNSRRKIEAVISVFEREVNPSNLRSITASVLSNYGEKLRKLGRSEATIRSHFVNIKAALSWARSNGYLDEVPSIPRVTLARASRAKGRALTPEEFGFMVLAVSRVVERPAVASWRRLLIGLWLSGLRLEESLKLTWQRDGSYEDALWIDTSGKYALLGIHAEAEKGKRDRLLPLTPDFSEWLMQTPDSDRDGFVFPLIKERYKSLRSVNHISKVISAIGEASGVKVSASGKFASAHDLRRSFGLRWASRLMPAELKLLMRHSDISTTMSYYVSMDANDFAEKLWREFPR